MELPFDTGDAGEPAASTLASKVLVVDDEGVVRDVLTRLLARESDISVANADDAEAALALLRAEKFDVLITDKNLPGMGGIELIAQARKLRPHLDAVLITGYPSGESIVAALAAGASDYLVKPFDDLRTVRAKVRAALQRRAERACSRELARSMAREAAELLERGHQVAEPVWKALEAAFARYEQSIGVGGGGKVAVVGPQATVDLLWAAGLPAKSETFGAPELDSADVVVLELAGNWRQLAERLSLGEADLILLGGPQSDLSDLLEAIALRLELVDETGDGAKALPDRVRACLDRRAVEQAKAQVASALERFREALQASPG